MTSATERLRALLTERGVEYRQTEWIDGTIIKWHGSDGIEYGAQNGVSFDGPTGRLVLYGLTPEQAVEATLGRGTCHAVFEVDAMSEDERIGEFVCSECGETFGDSRDQWPNYCPNCGRRCVG